MKKDRSHWKVQKCDSFNEMEAIHINQWREVSGSDRAAAAWELVIAAWKLKKRDRK